MKKLILFIAALSLLAAVSCTGDDEATHALRSHGFTEINTNSYEYFACGKGDLTGLGFTAKNAAGNRVEGVVCCGWLKGCTVRF